MLLKDPEGVEHGLEEGVLGTNVGRDGWEGEVGEELCDLGIAAVELVVPEGDKREVKEVEDFGDGCSSEEGVEEGLRRGSEGERPMENHQRLHSSFQLAETLGTHTLELIPRIEQQRVLDASSDLLDLSSDARIASQTRDRPLLRAVRSRSSVLVEMSVDVVQMEKSDVLARRGR